MGYSLIVRSKARNPIPRSDAYPIAVAISRMSDIAKWCEIIPGSLEPGVADTIMLWELKDRGELKQEEFAEACRSCHVEDNLESEEAAAAYLDWLWGTTLCTVSLPWHEGLARQAYGALVDFVRSNGYDVEDPQTGRRIDISSSGELPPMR